MVQTNYINLDYLELMSDGDIDMKKTMLEMLFDEVPAEMNKMNELTKQNNWEELKRVSHKMKSTLAFIGCNDLTEANQTIEHIAKTGGDSSQIPVLMNKLMTVYPKAMDELKGVYDKL